MLRKLILISPVILLFSLSLRSQEMECGTKLTPEQKAYLEKTREARNNYRVPQKKKLTEVPVQIYILRKSDGNDGIDSSEVLNELSVTNDYYENAGIHFFRCGPVQFVDSNYFSPFYRSREDSLSKEYYKPGVLNLYFVEKLYYYPGRAVCGYSKFPPSKDRVFMMNKCSTNGSTLAHEIGHYFSLFHTHQGYRGPDPELVDRSNCETAGDELCSTPADPNLQGKVNTNCEYSYNEKDLNGDPYQPQVENVMSYARKTCRNLFTREQYAWIAYSLENDRFYMDCCAGPVADFKFAPTWNPKMVQFYDSSLLKNNSTWYFGDGNIDSSNLSTLSHSYDSMGIYQVSLIVENECGKDTQVIKLKITESGPVIAGVKEAEKPESPARVYPNPFRDQLNVEVNLTRPGPVKIQGVDLAGKDRTFLELSGLSPGRHTLKFTPSSLKGKFIILRVIVNNRVEHYKVFRKNP